MVCPGSHRPGKTSGVKDHWYTVTCDECSRQWERQGPPIEGSVPVHDAPAAVIDDVTTPAPAFGRAVVDGKLVPVLEGDDAKAVFDPLGVGPVLARMVEAAAAGPQSTVIPDQVERKPLRPIPPAPITNPRDERLVPVILRNSIEAFAERGVRPGAFLSAVLENDLTRACQSADVTNVNIIPAVVAYVFRRVPEEARGNPRTVAAWCKHRGLAGIQAGR